MRVAWITRLVLAVLTVVGAGVGSAAPAGAHPLGNFTTNRYARVEVGAAVVRVHYVLDEAELVAFRQRDAIADEGLAAYRSRRVEEIRDGLRLTLDGDEVPLRTVASRLAQPEGQGGLTTLRIDAVFEATLRGRTLAFEDANAPELLGWREIVADARNGAALGAGAPVTDRTDGLRNYPTDPGVAPLDVRSVTFGFTPGRGPDGAVGVGDGDDAAEAVRPDDRFAGLLASTTSSPLAVVGALVAAFAFGVVHALGPGHGKTVMAAYLVSTKGRRRDALALGAVVSLMHTASVLVIAGLLATVGRELDAARVYPALTLVAGLLVAAVGLRLLARRWRARRATAAHDHAHEHSQGDRHLEHRHDHHGHHGHHDDHGHHDHSATGHAHGGGSVAVLERPAVAPHQHHGHDHGPDGHTHDLPEDVKPLSRAGLLALGTSGGLFPSPSAVVVLVGAFALGRAVLGLAMIAAFSLGLASMLVTVGLVLVAGRDRLARSRFALHLPWLPIAGAAAIAVLGAVLVGQGVAQLR